MRTRLEPRFPQDIWCPTPCAARYCLGNLQQLYEKLYLELPMTHTKTKLLCCAGLELVPAPVDMEEGNI
jgi:hypothetical protein